MAADELLLARLEHLELARPGDDRPAGLSVTSLPLPRTAAGARTFTPDGPAEVQWKEGTVSASAGIEVGPGRGGNAHKS